MSNIRQEMVDKVIHLLENDQAKWHKTWENLHGRTMPYNPITNKDYRGANMIMLYLQQQDLPNSADPRWCTYKQAAAAGYQVKKGSLGTPIIFYDIRTKLMDGDKTILDIKAKTEKDKASEIVKFYVDRNPGKTKEIRESATNTGKYITSSPAAKIELLVTGLNKVTGENLSYDTNIATSKFTVFNYSQIDNVPDLVQIDKPEYEIHEQAQAIIDNSKAKIFYDQVDKNYYSPSDHEIHLTKPESFHTRDAYLSTALHELGHWSKGDGVSRNFEAREGNIDDYSREEIRAELTSIFVAAEIGLSINIQNHDAYLSHYLTILKKDPNEFFSAISDANKISNHLINYLHEKKLDVEVKTLETMKFGTINIANDKLATLKEKLFVWRDDQFNEQKFKDFSASYHITKNKTFVYDDGIGKKGNRELADLLNHDYTSNMNKSRPALFNEAAYSTLVAETRNAIKGYSRNEMLNLVINDLKSHGGKVSEKDVIEAIVERFNSLDNEVKQSINLNSEAELVKEEVEAQSDFTTSDLVI